MTVHVNFMTNRYLVPSLNTDVNTVAGERDDAADVRRQREQDDLHGPPHRPRLRCHC